MRRRIAALGLAERFETGQIEPADFVTQFSRALGVQMGYADFCRIWNSVFLPEPLFPESVIAEIRARHRLLLLSNTNAIHFEMLQKSYPILRHFDDRVLSYEVRAMKPQPEIFRQAIARAGCPPEACFFTDDIAGYASAAREHGIDAVQFHSFEQAQQEMRARGILP
jgi:glucose-1-phosphatase